MLKTNLKLVRVRACARVCVCVCVCVSLFNDKHKCQGLRIKAEKSDVGLKLNDTTPQQKDNPRDEMYPARSVLNLW